MTKYLANGLNATQGLYIQVFIKRMKITFIIWYTKLQIFIHETIYHSLDYKMKKKWSNKTKGGQFEKDLKKIYVWFSVEYPKHKISEKESEH